jgi:hypothetical protein
MAAQSREEHNSVYIYLPVVAKENRMSSLQVHVVSGLRCAVSPRIVLIVWRKHLVP